MELEPSYLIYDSTVPRRCIHIYLQVVDESICIVRWLCWFSFIILYQFDVVFDDILAEIWHCETLLSRQEDLAKKACDSMHLHD